MDKKDRIADELANIVMAELYGKRFTETDDITDDREMSDTWDYLSDNFYGVLMKILPDD